MLELVHTRARIDSELSPENSGSPTLITGILCSSASCNTVAEPPDGTPSSVQAITISDFQRLTQELTHVPGAEFPRLPRSQAQPCMEAQCNGRRFVRRFEEWRI